MEESKKTRTLRLTVTCMACYNSSIEVPADMTLEEAVGYAKDHIDEVAIETPLEYVTDSDILDENCSFDDGKEEKDE